MLNAACKDCTERYIGCHSHCKEYKEFRSELDRINGAREEQSRAVSEYIQYRKDKARKGRK